MIMSWALREGYIDREMADIMREANEAMREKVETQDDQIEIENDAKRQNDQDQIK